MRGNCRLLDSVAEALRQLYTGRFSSRYRFTRSRSLRPRASKISARPWIFVIPRSRGPLLISALCKTFSPRCSHVLNIFPRLVFRHERSTIFRRIANLLHPFVQRNHFDSLALQSSVSRVHRVTRCPGTVHLSADRCRFDFYSASMLLRLGDTLFCS